MNLNITKNVQNYLLDNAAIQALVTAGDIGSDAGFTRGWIFDTNLEVRMENTQKAAITVSYGGGWTAPLDGNTAHFPLVVVDIWSDPERSADNTPVPHSAKDKAFDIYEVLFAQLHLAHHAGVDGSTPIYFNGTRVSSSEAIGEPSLLNVASGNGLQILRCNFGITTF